MYTDIQTDSSVAIGLDVLERAARLTINHLDAASISLACICRSYTPYWLTWCAY